MKLEQFKNKEYDEQLNMLRKCDKVLLHDAVEHPKLVEGKIVAFRGNYSDFKTEGLCIRKFEYSDGFWFVSDMNLKDCREYKPFKNPFDAHGVWSQFPGFYNSEGYLLDKDD